MFTKKFALFPVIIAALSLSACATPYTHDGALGGYNDTRLAENVFQVSFQGNGYTSEQRVADFTLLRSAEVAMQNGYNYFIIVKEHESARSGAFTTPTSSYTTGSVYGSGNYAYGSATTTTTGGQTFLFSIPSSRNTIVCYKDKPEINGLVYNAKIVAASIRKKYNIKTTPKGATDEGGGANTNG